MDVFAVDVAVLVVGAVATPFALKHCYAVSAFAGLALHPKR